MSRPRKPELLISDHANFQRGAFTREDLAPLSAEQERDLINRHLHDVDDEAKAVQAVQLAINMARMEQKKAPVSQGEHKTALEDQARRAAQLLEYVRPPIRGRTMPAGDRYYTWAVTAIHADAESFVEDPMIKHRRLLADLLELIEQRSTSLAEQIDPEAYRKNNPQHVLAEYLVKGTRNGTLPMQYSDSKTSRLAALFEWCCTAIGIERGNPHTYLKDK